MHTRMWSLMTGDVQPVPLSARVLHANCSLKQIVSRLRRGSLVKCSFYLVAERRETIIVNVLAMGCTEPAGVRRVTW